MGIFSDYVRKYHEAGIPCIPCGEKKQPITGKEWQKYCDVLPTENEVEDWEIRYQDCQRLGLVMGEASGIVAFDFDYEWDEKKSKIDKKLFNKDVTNVEKQILAILPPTPCKKKGKKGWTAFYRYNKFLKNLSCDRNGVRLFDFLAWHKQTILPPSLHSGDIKYKWIGVPLDECVGDLPEIDIEQILEIKNMFGHDLDAAPKSRHMDLFKHVMSIVQVEEDREKLILSLIQKDKEINKPTYLDDLKHNRTNNSYENAARWIDRILRWKSASVGIADVKKQFVNDSSWAYFFENSFYKVKKDIMTKDIFIKRDENSEWLSIKGLDGVLRAYADRKLLPVHKVTDQLAKWSFEKKNLDFLCDIPSWDGTDRIKEIASCIKSKEFNDNEISDIFKKWGSGIFRRVQNPNAQNECIILKGGQGLGKDTLVKALLKDFKPYYNQTLLSGTQKDVLEIVSRLLVVHIEEFEQTRSLDMGFLKSLITQNASFFREAYGSTPTEKIMRPSFISTANVDDLLRDSTGNRRFIVINVDRIDWKYPKNQSLMVVAQWKHYCEQGLYTELSDDIKNKIDSIINSYTPDDISMPILELYLDAFNRMNAFSSYTVYKGLKCMKPSEMLPVLADIAKNVGCKPGFVRRVIKNKGLSRHTRDGMRYFATNFDEKSGNFEIN